MRLLPRRCEGDDGCAPQQGAVHGLVCGLPREGSPVTAEGGTPVGGQAYWYGFQKPEAAVASDGVIKAKGPNDCWQCHK